jgi:hypothetical protein
MLKGLLFLIFPIALLVSCKKQSDLNGIIPLFSSTDSVYFDTIFTSLGGVTQKVKLINPNNRSIGISSISLVGGSNSPFIINIDGSPGPTASDLNIAANDSLYIFVSVYVKPQAGPIPFILEDSIRVSYNGFDKIIKLSVWGQNAHFLKNQLISSNTDWPNDLPYVIYGGLRVDSNATLTIQPGTHIYMHADAPLYIDGSLKVLGDSGTAKLVYFSGDRLDQPYSHYPGSWPGIFFGESSGDNLLNYAVFQNGFHGLVAAGTGPDLNPKLSLNQCIINNFLQEGIMGIESSIHAVNCLISNCGQNIVLGLGGNYQFSYCTVASYSNELVSHQMPVLTVSNAATEGGQVLTSDLNAAFVNCIFWGSQGVPDEAIVQKQGNTVFNVLFDHSILKQANYPANIDSNFLWLNTNPAFIDTSGYPVGSYNFQLETGSPALDQGADLGIPIDLNGNPRPATLSDLGSYERQ